jgi:hypothetical protein
MLEHAFFFSYEEEPVIAYAQEYAENRNGGFHHSSLFIIFWRKAEIVLNRSFNGIYSMIRLGAPENHEKAEMPT